jgi:two-component system LytT family response regulator
MVKTVIIEDEIASQELLSQIIKDYCPTLKLIGIASSLTDSVKIIKDKSPQLIFMDIELEETNAFQILDKLNIGNLNIIFTTAYEQYALRAFKYDIIDYLLKPYSPKAVIKAVAKATKHFTIQEKKSNKSHRENHGKLSVATSHGYSFIDINEIIRIEAEEGYCQIYMINDKKCLANKTLKDIENNLPQSFFYRSHISHIINLKFAKEYIKEDGGFIVLKNGEVIPISRRKKKEFLNLLTNETKN